MMPDDRTTALHVGSGGCVMPVDPDYGLASRVREDGVMQDNRDHDSACRSRRLPDAGRPGLCKQGKGGCVMPDDRDYESKVTEVV